MYWEHGRRYARDYFMPNDEDEQDRLRILHQIYLNIFNLELTTIPLENPTAVLDVGTMDVHREQPAVGVGQDVALAPTDAALRGRPPGSAEGMSGVGWGSRTSMLTPLGAWRRTT